MSRDATAPRDRTKTKQDHTTPADLLDAAEARFGTILFDLAASDGQEVRPHLAHFTPAQDSLAQRWPCSHLGSPHDWAQPNGVLWLNPPYSPDITPWAARCATWRLEAARGLVLCFLVPYSADTEWWRDSVRGKSHVVALKTRPKFSGEAHGYPKPMALVVYDPRYPDCFAESLWDWKGTGR